MKKEYKVRFMLDNTYEVIEIIFDKLSVTQYESVFQGNLSECEAYIRLCEGGYMS